MLSPPSRRSTLPSLVRGTLSLHPALPAHATCSARPGVSTDSKFSHFAWASSPRKQGGLGPDLKLPLVADRNMSISRDYNVLIEEEGIALRGLFIIDPKGTLRYVQPGRIYTTCNLTRLLVYRQITVNDLPVGRSVEETIRLVKAFQFTVCGVRIDYIAACLTSPSL